MLSSGGEASQRSQIRRRGSVMQLASQRHRQARASFSASFRASSIQLNEEESDPNQDKSEEYHHQQQQHHHNYDSAFGIKKNQDLSINLKPTDHESSDIETETESTTSSDENGVKKTISVEKTCSYVGSKAKKALYKQGRELANGMRLAFAGFSGGMQSIFYIFGLLIIVVYLYAIICITYVGGNDPWHFGSIELAVITLFRIAILDLWTPIFYVSYKGCGSYAGDYYTHEPVNMTTYKLGDPIYCAPNRTMLPAETYILGENGAISNGQPVTAIVIFISFIFLATFCVLSLIIGAVSIAMYESTARFNQSQQKKEDLLAKKLRKDGPKDRNTRKALDCMHLSFHGHIPSMTNDHAITCWDAYERATYQGWSRTLEEMRIITFNNPHNSKIECVDKTNNKHVYGQVRASHTSVENRKKMSINWLQVHTLLCNTCAAVADSHEFHTLVTLCILFTAVMAGLVTLRSVDKAYSQASTATETIISYIFLIEFLIKLGAEKEGHFLYFSDPWNRLDFAVVFFSFAPILPRNLVMLTRLIKLLRILKLIEVMPDLRATVEATLDGVMQVYNIGILLLIFLLIFGSIGNFFFGENDPYRFGSLEMSLITLFQISTFDAWADALYTTIFGCDVYGNNDWGCENPKADFWGGVAYFIFAMIIGGCVMLTLFVGVMSISLERSSTRIVASDEEKNLLAELRERYEISDVNMSCYRMVFDLIDLSKIGSINFIEIAVAIELTGSNHQYHVEVFQSVDDEPPVFITFGRFVRYLMQIRTLHLQRKTAFRKMLREIPQSEWDSSFEQKADASDRARIYHHARLTKSLGAAAKRYAVTTTNIFMYKIENFLCSYGLSSFFILILCFIILVLIMALVWHLSTASSGFEVLGKESYADAIFLTLQVFIGASFTDGMTDEDEDNGPIRGLYVVIELCYTVFFATLISLVIQHWSSRGEKEIQFIAHSPSLKYKKLRRKESRVRVARSQLHLKEINRSLQYLDHVLIIGWNRITANLVCKLLFAHEHYQIYRQKNRMMLACENFTNGCKTIMNKIHSFFVPGTSSEQKYHISRGSLVEPSFLHEYKCEFDQIVIMADDVTEHHIHSTIMSALMNAGVEDKRIDVKKLVRLWMTTPNKSRYDYLVNADAAAARLVISLDTKRDQRILRTTNGSIINGSTLQVMNFFCNHRNRNRNRNLSSMTKSPEPDDTGRKVFSVLTHPFLRSEHAFTADKAGERDSIEIALVPFLNTLIFRGTIQPGLIDFCETLVDVGSCMTSSNTLCLQSVKVGLLLDLAWQHQEEEGQESSSDLSETFEGLQKKYYSCHFLGLYPSTRSHHQKEIFQGYGLCPDPKKVLKETDHIVLVSSVSQSLSGIISGVADPDAMPGRSLEEANEDHKSGRAIAGTAQISHGLNDNIVDMQLKNILIVGWRMLWSMQTQCFADCILGLMNDLIKDSMLHLCNTISMKEVEAAVTFLGFVQVEDSSLTSKRSTKYYHEASGIYLYHHYSKRNISKETSKLLKEYTFDDALVLNTHLLDEGSIASHHHDTELLELLTEMQTAIVPESDNKSNKLRVLVEYHDDWIPDVISDRINTNNNSGCKFEFLNLSRVASRWLMLMISSSHVKLMLSDIAGENDSSCNLTVANATFYLPWGSSTSFGVIKHCVTSCRQGRHICIGYKRGNEAIQICPKLNEKLVVDNDLFLLVVRRQTIPSVDNHNLNLNTKVQKSRHQVHEQGEINRTRSYYNTIEEEEDDDDKISEITESVWDDRSHTQGQGPSQVLGVGIEMIASSSRFPQYSNTNRPYPHSHSQSQSQSQSTTLPPLLRSVSNESKISTSSFSIGDRDNDEYQEQDSSILTGATDSDSEDDECTIM